VKLRHIEIFHAVYVNGSVSAAARALNVSQPSVTKVLQHAEQLLGFPLFVRTKGRLVPTEDAHNLFAEVSDIQERVYELRQTSQNMRHGRGGMVRVSALPSLGLGAIPDAVARFLASHEGVAFDLQTAHHDEMMRRLYERGTDIAVGFEVPRGAPVAHTKVGTGELVVMYRESDLPDAGERLSLADLENRAFISPIQSGPIGQLLSAELHRVGVELNEVVSTRTFYIAASLVRSGVGLTIVDSFTARATLTPGLAYRPIEPALPFGVYAVYLENRPPSALATSFLRDLGAVIAGA
jgi:DNA-binding transcriptional LysR family regulator